MSDIIDDAQALNELYQEKALAVARERAAKQETHPDFDGKSCVMCGDSIPIKRLELGKIRCVPCQSDIERLGNGYRK